MRNTVELLIKKARGDSLVVQKIMPKNTLNWLKIKMTRS